MDGIYCKYWESGAITGEKIIANTRRVARVSSLVKREVSQMLLNDFQDDKIGLGIVSITNVEMSGDLQHAKIFVSIYGNAENKTATLNRLKSSAGFVRRELAHRVRLRRTPEVVFLEAPSLEGGDSMLDLLNTISKEGEES